MSKGVPLVVFDFDHTLLDVNSDVEIQKLLPGLYLKSFSIFMPKLFSFATRYSKGKYFTIVCKIIFQKIDGKVSDDLHAINKEQGWNEFIRQILIRLHHNNVRWFWINFDSIKINCNLWEWLCNK